MTVLKVLGNESISKTSEENVRSGFLEDIKFDGTRHITKLPFKHCCEFLPD